MCVCVFVVLWSMPLGRRLTFVIIYFTYTGNKKALEMEIDDVMKGHEIYRQVK